MRSKYLILGATGSLGYAFTRELLNQGLEVEILARNQQKAKDLFHSNPLLTVHRGSLKDWDVLQEAASGKQFIFFGINYPYSKWGQEMMPALKKVVELARQNGSCLLFPGNIYAYGNVAEPITEASEPMLNTKKGRLRNELERYLEHESAGGAFRVINLRLPDFWGPNVTNGLIKPLFGNAARGKSMNWLIRADVAHQFVYTPDAARVFCLLTAEEDLPHYFLINYGGRVHGSLHEFSQQISQAAGSPHRLRLLSKNILHLLGAFIPDVRELRENFYQFENCVALDDSAFRARYPEFRETSLADALAETLAWYRSFFS